MHDSRALEPSRAGFFPVLLKDWPHAGQCLAGILLAVVAGLSGCASGDYAMRMKTADQPPLEGELVIGIGPSDVSLASKTTEFTCEGTSLVAYAAPGCGTASGELRLTCSDGREITADWEMIDCISGEGSGLDSAGNPVFIQIGEIGKPSIGAPVSGKSRVARSKLPAVQRGMLAGVATGSVDLDTGEREVDGHLFRIGGGYAAGFGKAERFAYPAVFTSESTDLVIVKINAAQPPVYPMSLRSDDIQPGEEVFIILPGENPAGESTAGGRVVGITPSLRNDGKAGFSSDAVTATGLPVMDADGFVVGLTARGGTGWYVLGAAELRRYLAIAASTAASEPASASTAAELRERIMTPHRD